MTTYINTDPRPDLGGEGADVGHSWERFTDARMRWLYGDGHSIERRAATTADLTTWRNLGKGRAAA